jgi:hypothetical protein
MLSRALDLLTEAVLRLAVAEFAAADVDDRDVRDEVAVLPRAEEEILEPDAMGGGGGGSIRRRLPAAREDCALRAAGAGLLRAEPLELTGLSTS